MKAILSIFIILFLSVPTHACDCAEILAINDNWTYADDVYIGKVTNADTLDLKDQFRGVFVLYTIEIIEPLKEDFHKEHKFRTFLSRGGGTCDQSFILGETFLIYARKNEIFFSSSICSRSNLLKSVKEAELVELRELYQKKRDSKLASPNIPLSGISNNDYEINLAHSTIQKQKEQIKILSIVSFILISLIILQFIIKNRKSKD